MSLRSDTVSFWFWGYIGDIRTELQAPVFQAGECHMALTNDS